MKRKERQESRISLILSGLIFPLFYVQYVKRDVNVFIVNLNLLGEINLTVYGHYL